MKEILGQKAYDVQEVTELLKVGKNFVTRKIRNGELKATRVGRCYYITETHLQEFMKLS